MAIVSVQNPLIKRIRSLSQRKYRHRQGLFFVEGIRAVDEALTTRAPVDRIVYSPERLRSARAMATIRAAAEGGVEAVEVSAKVFDSISSREEGQGIGAVVRVRARGLDDLKVGRCALVVALVEPRDPGNLGSIVRTADCAGASGLVVVGTSSDLYDPKSVRASMGSLFALPVVAAPDPAALAAWSKAAGAACIGTSAHARRSCFEFDMTGPLVLVLGPERGGLDKASLEVCDEVICIPMHGRGSSLNLSAAAAVLLFEAMRQRKE